MAMVRRASGVAALTGLALLLMAGPTLANWPNANPAQPLVQAPNRCALGVAPINRRCHVIDFTDLGEIAGHQWYYAFYATHWADRHGKMDRGFPIFFYLQKPATLRLGLWINDEPGLAGPWARKPPARPVLVQRPDGTYIGMTLKAVRGQDDQRLVRIEGVKWKSISTLYRSDEDRALLAGVTPQRCQSIDDGAYDWSSFRFVMALKTSSGDPCGVITTGLDVRNDKLVLINPVLAPPPEAVGAVRRP